ncbi:hypothetical protein [Sanguibacter massiliensis]|uniref:hypothetical protein n=1 Tax=Sanguibacter massiliensis TaxID=1973217 RepID=UPI00101ADAA4|nr:hypothetical protein [Sanguibacter massiliensis]
MTRRQISVPSELWTLGQRRFFGMGRDSEGVEFLFRVSGVSVELSAASRKRWSTRSRTGELRKELMSFEWIATSSRDGGALPAIDEFQTPVGDHREFSVEGLECHRWIVNESSLAELREKGPSVAAHVPDVARSLRGAPALGGLAVVGELDAGDHGHAIVGVTLLDYDSVEDGAGWKGIEPAFETGTGCAGRPTGLVPAAIELDLSFEWCGNPERCSRRHSDSYRGGAEGAYGGYGSFIGSVLRDMADAERSCWMSILCERLIVR